MGCTGSWGFFSPWLEGEYEQCMKFNGCLLFSGTLQGGHESGRHDLGESGQTNFCVPIPQTLLRPAMADSQDPSHDRENLKGSNRVMCKEKLEMGVKGAASPSTCPQPTSAAPTNGTGNGLKAMTWAGYPLLTSPRGCDLKAESD